MWVDFVVVVCVYFLVVDVAVVVVVVCVYFICCCCYSLLPVRRSRGILAAPCAGSQSAVVGCNGCVSEVHADWRGRLLHRRLAARRVR